MFNHFAASALLHCYTTTALLAHVCIPALITLSSLDVNYEHIQSRDEDAM